MFNDLKKIVFIFLLNLIISAPIYAKTVEQKNINFTIQTNALLKGEVHYYFEILSPRTLPIKHAEVFDLDALSLIQENNVMMVLSKSVTIIDKPVGFFDDKQMTDEKFLAHILDEQKIKKLGPSSYSVSVPGETSYSYKMNSFFDADDVSTLPNSKVIRAVSAAKKLDVIAQSASTIMFVEKTNFTKFTEGGVSVSSFIPMKENKTLIITYNLWAIKKPFVVPKVLKANFLSEIEAVKELMNNYKP